MHALNEELANLKGSVDGLETERDFYFAKVRFASSLSPFPRRVADSSFSCVSFSAEGY